MRRKSLIHNIFLQAAYNKLGEFSTLIGPFHKDSNHWTLVVVDIENNEPPVHRSFGPCDRTRYSRGLHS